MTTKGTDFELVLTGARVIDGCGNPWYRADVAVAGDQIAAVAPPKTLKGRRTIDVADRYLTPGFVDPHTHSDIAVLVYPQADTAVRQGVTTHVTGNCGMSPAPATDGHLDDLLVLWDHYGLRDPSVAWSWRTFEQYVHAVEAGGLALNIAPLIGHNALRLAAMGWEQRAASPAEQARMEELLTEAMTHGAFGLSTGLVYPPGCYSDTAEIVGLCRVVARFHGLYASHVRGERETILDAVAEAIEIGRQAGVPVEVSHNAPKWGAPKGAHANLALIAAARGEGLDVTADNDVHTDLAPRFSRALPQTLHDLTADELVATLSDPAARARIRDEVVREERPGAGYSGLLRHGAYDRIVVLYAPSQPQLEGVSVADVAASRGADPFETFLDLIVEERDRVVGIFDYIHPDDIRAVIEHPFTMICSDGFVSAPPDASWTSDLYWPCNYGEYPGILERFVRDDPVLTLEAAIRKMTSFPAQRFGLLDRGVLRPGMRADLVVFDLDRVRDRATNPYPHTKPFVNIPPAYPEGIDHVIVNGVSVISDGEHTGALPGRVLRRD